MKRMPPITLATVRLACLAVVAATFLFAGREAGVNLLFVLVVIDLGAILFRFAFRVLQRLIQPMRKWAAGEAIRQLAEVDDEWQARLDDEAKRLSFTSLNVRMLGAQTEYFALFLRPFSNDDLVMPTPRWLAARVSVRMHVPPETFCFPGSEIQPITTYELALKACLNNIAPLISVAPPSGRKSWRVRQRAGHLSISTEDWKSRVLELMRQAKIVFILPGKDPGVLWEIQTVLSDAALARKTLFISPRMRGSKLELFNLFSTYGAIEKSTGLRFLNPSTEQAALINVTANPSDFGTIPLSKDGRFKLSAIFSPFDGTDLKRLNHFLRVCTKYCGVPEEATPIASFHYLPDVPFHERIPFGDNGTSLPSGGGAGQPDT